MRHQGRRETSPGPRGKFYTDPSTVLQWLIRAWKNYGMIFGTEEFYPIIHLPFLAALWDTCSEFATIEINFLQKHWEYYLLFIKLVDFVFFWRRGWWWWWSQLLSGFAAHLLAWLLARIGPAAGTGLPMYVQGKLPSRLSPSLPTGPKHRGGGDSCPWKEAPFVGVSRIYSWGGPDSRCL